MGVLLLVEDVDVVQLDVEVLIDRVQDASDRQVVLELHHHLLAHQALEERVEQL
jgi:hypothetical protein